MSNRFEKVAVEIWVEVLTYLRDNYIIKDIELGISLESGGVREIQEKLEWWFK